MSSDQNLNHHTNGLAPEPHPLTWIRAHAAEQGAAAGVATQDTWLAANLDSLAISKLAAAGDQARLPPQAMEEQGLILETGAGTEFGMTWGVLSARSRPAPQVGGNTPVRTPHQQRIAHLRSQIERELQKQNISESDGTQVPGDEHNSSVPSNLHQSGSQSTSPFQTSNSLTPIQNMAGTQFPYSQEPGTMPCDGRVSLSPTFKVDRERLNAQIFKGANQSRQPQSGLQMQQEIAETQRAHPAATIG